MYAYAKYNLRLLAVLELSLAIWLGEVKNKQNHRHFWPESERLFVITPRAAAIIAKIGMIQAHNKWAKAGKSHGTSK